jgi:hypothetical protein
MHKLRLAITGSHFPINSEPECSPQFAQRVRAVVEGLEELRSDLQKEGDATTRIWKKREAQLTRMATGMLSMVGDLQGIGQGAVEKLGCIAVLSSAEVVDV